MDIVMFLAGDIHKYHQKSCQKRKTGGAFILDGRWDILRILRITHTDTLGIYTQA